MADLWELSPGLAVYLLIFAALLGSVWASFSGCAASRMKNGESFLKGRSHCDSCGHVLKPLDLVPIFSATAKRRSLLSALLPKRWELHPLF